MVRAGQGKPYAKRGIPYAWIVLAVLFIGQVASFGMRSSFGAYISPWEHEFSANRTLVSSISMLSFVVFALGQPLAGRLNDRFGKSFVPSVSLFLMGACLLLTTQAGQVWQVFLFYGVGFSLGVSGCCNAIVSVITTNWFVEKRGLALGLVMSSLGVGQLVLIPANLFIIERLGWRDTMSMLSIIIMVVVGPLFIFLLRSRPEEKGLRPYGWTGGVSGTGGSGLGGGSPAIGPRGGEFASGSANGTGGSGLGGDPASGLVDSPAGNILENDSPGNGPVSGLLPIAGVFRLRVFWLIFVSYFICGFTDVGLIQTHLIPIVQMKGFPVSSAALAFSLIAVSNIVGTIVTGFLSDRVSRTRQLSIIYAIRACTYIFLILIRRPWQIPVFAVINGSMDMASIAPTNSLAVQLFDRYSAGTVLGLVAISHQLGGAFGSLVPGLLYDLTGSYSIMLTIAVFMLFGASLASLWIKDTEPGKK